MVSKISTSLYNIQMYSSNIGGFLRTLETSFTRTLWRFKGKERLYFLTFKTKKRPKEFSWHWSNQNPRLKSNWAKRGPQVQIFQSPTIIDSVWSPRQDPVAMFIASKCRLFHFLRTCWPRFFSFFFFFFCLAKECGKNLNLSGASSLPIAVF